MENKSFLTIVGTARRRLNIFPIYKHHDPSGMIVVWKYSVLLWIGEHDLRFAEGNEQIIPIDKIIVHPSYNQDERPRYDYDVALVKLRDSINFNINVRPVCLPTMDFLPGTNCYVTGWGNTTEGGNISQVNILILCVQSFHLHSRVALQPYN